MNTYTIANKYSTPFQIQGKSFRIDKTGTLIIISRHYATVAAYPAGYWLSITQYAEQQTD